MIFIAPESIPWMTDVLLSGVITNVIIMIKEIIIHHDTPETKKAIGLMTKGYYSKYLWIGIVFGNLTPILMLTTHADSMILIAGGFVLIGIYLTEFVRIRVPQMIPMS